MIIVDRISQLPNGQPVDAGTPVELRREIDGTLLDTQLTDIDGWVTFQSNGSPGPVYTQVTIGSEVRYRYGRAVAQVGSWFEGEWNTFMEMVEPGVIMSRNSDALKVVPSAGLTISVSPGSAIAEGILGRYFQPESISVDGNGSGNSRYDLVVMRLHSGGSQVGRVVIDLVKGTPASLPVDPPVDPMPDVAQLILARVRVQEGVSLIQASDITDLRPEGSFVRDGSISTAKLANGSVTPAKLDRLYSLMGHSHSWGQITGKPALAPSIHSHSWGEITGKPTSFTPSTHSHAWSQITGRPTTFAPSSHTHSWSQITEKPSLALSTHSHSWSQITSKPTSFTPSSHSHSWSETTGKPTSFTPSSHTHTWGQVTGKPSTFAPSSHSHSWSQITSKPTSLSGFFPNNKTTSGGSDRLMRTAPGNDHNAIILLKSGWGFHDTGYRQTTDEEWAYCMLPGVGFGWIPTAKIS